ncbi:hypothetical protein O0I10_002720 [Lichtheimia ornata]|uniref:Uncharacterized protein n=1 Tax=Lichtheimia ornata TaxID=688661 RepID=A0AAD7V9C7_9FUNG|nr:uncharacterized protein O0I10_002720 [Lichtheimia ornata]KAJ8661454.1 hypothetical protein O0I10_002720 [Lichtheimia ornata]
MLLTRPCLLQRARLLLRLRARQSCVRLYGSSRKRSWFDRFLTPKEEQELYFNITSTFRDYLQKQSTKSAKSYSNIIEQVILTGHTAPATTIPFHRLNAIKQQLDDPSTTVSELESLWREMNKGQVSSVAMYNRLIRAFIRCDALSTAEKVFQQLKLMPTTRTFTYLIDAHVKAGNVDKARMYVERMQYLDQVRPRHPFDYSVMLRYYIQAEEPHAVDLLWNDLQHHVDTIKPGWSLYAYYMDWLVTRGQFKALERLISSSSQLPSTPPPRQMLPVLDRIINTLLTSSSANEQTLGQALRRRINDSIDTTSSKS